MDSLNTKIESIYITQDTYDLVNRQFWNLVRKYDCKHTVNDNNIHGVDLLLNYLFGTFYPNVPNNRRSKLYSVAKDLLRFYKGLNSDEVNLEEDEVLETIPDDIKLSDYLRNNYKGKIYKVIIDNFSEEDSDFIHAFASNHNHLPVFYIIIKWFSESTDRDMEICDEVIGITQKKQTMDDVAVKHVLSHERIRQIVSKSDFKETELYKLLDEDMTDDSYPFINHSVIRDLDSISDKIEEEENVHIDGLMLGNVLSLFGDYQTYTCKDKNGDSYRFAVNNNDFDKQFEDDWLMLTKLVNGKKRYYPIKVDRSLFFQYDESISSDTTKNKDIDKLISDVFGVKVVNGELFLPINIYDIEGFARRLSESEERPLSFDYFYMKLKESFPRKELKTEAEVEEIISVSTYLTCKRFKDALYLKSKALRKYNMGVLAFFDYWTHTSDKPVAVRRAFDCMSLLTMQALTETIDLYKQHFVYLQDDYGINYIGASEKEYGDDYHFITSKDLFS